MRVPPAPQQFASSRRSSEERAPSCRRSSAPRTASPRQTGAVRSRNEELQHSWSLPLPPGEGGGEGVRTLDRVNPLTLSLSPWERRLDAAECSSLLLLKPGTSSSRTAVSRAGTQSTSPQAGCPRTGQWAPAQACPRPRVGGRGDTEWRHPASHTHLWDWLEPLPGGPGER
jgi:hypothetical protein